MFVIYFSQSPSADPPPRSPQGHGLIPVQGSVLVLKSLLDPIFFARLSGIKAVPKKNPPPPASLAFAAPVGGATLSHYLNSILNLSSNGRFVSEGVDGEMAEGF